MPEIKPRYEFRVWAETLTPIREQLECLAPPRKTVSQEIYLISATTDKCNAKIRADLMDIKYSSHILTDSLPSELELAPRGVFT